jgi:hypothetical protein
MTPEQRQIIEAKDQMQKILLSSDRMLIATNLGIPVALLDKFALTGEIPENYLEMLYTNLNQ